MEISQFFSSVIFYTIAVELKFQISISILHLNLAFNISPF